MPPRQLREFVMEAYYSNIRSDVIADVTGLDVKYIYGLVYKQGLREVRDIKQRDQALELAEELGIDLDAMRLALDQEELRQAACIDASYIEEAEPVPADTWDKALERSRSFGPETRPTLSFFLRGKT